MDIDEEYDTKHMPKEANTKSPNEDEESPSATPKSKKTACMCMCRQRTISLGQAV
jgi:hypothetical protein